MDGNTQFILFFFLMVLFGLMNISTLRKERKKAEEELQRRSRERSTPLKESSETTEPSK
jgi:hypothetical protein